MQKSSQNHSFTAGNKGDKEQKAKYKTKQDIVYNKENTTTHRARRTL